MVHSANNLCSGAQKSIISVLILICKKHHWEARGWLVSATASLNATFAETLSLGQH